MEMNHSSTRRKTNSVPQRQQRLDTAGGQPTAFTGTVVRTALAIEPRGGRLWAFLPPVSTTEDYIELIAALENTAARLKMPRS